MASPRARLALAGDWDFWPEKDHLLTRNPLDPEFIARHRRDATLGAARKITVPGPWQAQFDDLRHFSGCAWYECSFIPPAEWKTRRTRVCFGAVDYLCTVWVNGRRAGQHEGGYLPFACDISRLIRSGEPNYVTLLVLDPGPGDEDPVAFAEIPHGKQSWYGPLGGPWQTVFLEATAPSFVERALIRPHPSGAVVASVRVDGVEDEQLALECCITSPDGTETWSSAPIEVSGAVETIEVDVSSIGLWAPESPRLYSLELTLSRDGRTHDRWSDVFGFRTIRVEDGSLLLNEEPLYLLGALDQNYYLGGICTPPSDNVVREDILRARELGLNCLRCHIKIPDPRYLYWADRLGMLVWAEPPNWGTLTGAAAARARATFQGLVERDFNHPSVIIWTIANESWGLDVAGNAEHRAWLKDTWRWAKELDPTRLVVDNSACPPNFHLVSDLNDFHLYRAWPEGEERWKRWTAGWVADPASTYSPHGDAEPRADAPLVLSEFGNWGLPDTGELVDEAGREPWWFRTGEGWGEGAAKPEGVRERFDAWELETVFGSWSEFVRHSQEHQFEGMRASIQDLRSHPDIRGYVVTEFTDVHWECNGLLDMARNPKSYHDRFRDINALDVVWATPRQRRLRSGEAIELAVLVSHFSSADLEGGEVTWTIRLPHDDAAAEQRRGRLGPLEVGRGAVARVGEIDVTMPPLDRPGRASIEVVLRDKHGRRRGRSASEVLLFPEAEQTSEGAAEFPGPARHGVAVAPTWSDELARHLAGGGRALILAGHETALPPGLGLALEARTGGRWEGDWAQGMGWLRPPLHAGLELGPRVSGLFAGLTPELVVLGYTPDAATDVLAGLYLGWIRDVVATIGAFAAGAGAGLLCTWPLERSYGHDPLATVLLDRLVELAASPGLAPRTRLEIPT
jgi:hypothetical protein